MRTFAAPLVLGLSVCLTAQTPLQVGPLPDAAPLSVSACATPNLLIVELALAPEWHAYARDVGGGQPVAVRLAADCDFEARAPLAMPADRDGKLVGDVRLELPIGPRGTGTDLCATLELMVCDALECLPPISVAIAGEVRAVAVLLVVDEVDDRSARIEAFLKEHGFEVEVATYVTVTAAQCERRDVVLADSKLFGKTAKVRQHVLEFPKTRTPIVAVGFFGTELIEAHGIAMTSGYI